MKQWYVRCVSLYSSDVCHLYGNAFGYHPLIGCVCVRSVVSVQAALDPQWGAMAFWILAMEWVSCVWPAGKGSPKQGLNAHRNGRQELSSILTLHANDIIQAPKIVPHWGHIGVSDVKFSLHLVPPADHYPDICCNCRWWHVLNVPLLMPNK